MQILSQCPDCKKTEEWVFPAKDLNCSCGKPRLREATDPFLETSCLNQCPLCGCAHIYRQKDFNRNLGVGLIVVGVLLAYWTYGISLLLVTLIDWALLTFVKEVGVCYRCQAQFRNSSEIAKLEPFNLSLHDYYRSLPND